MLYSLVDRNKIVVSDKFRCNGKGFKCFLGYKKDDIRALCIILPQISWYIKYLNDGRKNMSFLKLKMIRYFWNIMKFQ